MIIKFIKKYLGSLIARLHLAVVKSAIDKYILDQQLEYKA